MSRFWRLFWYYGALIGFAVAVPIVANVQRNGLPHFSVGQWLMVFLGLVATIVGGSLGVAWGRLKQIQDRERDDKANPEAPPP
jgi:hypothetical protein